MFQKEKSSDGTVGGFFFKIFFKKQNHTLNLLQHN